MAIGALFLLYVIILFSFVVSSIFMFVPKEAEVVHKIFFALSVMLSVFITIINATALPSNYTVQVMIAWLALIPSGIGIIAAAFKGKPGGFSKFMVMLTSILGAALYFIF